MDETAFANFGNAIEKGEILVLLKDCLSQTHKAKLDTATNNPNFASMGSTTVAAIINQDQVCSANVGDCRAYLIHRNQMTQLSYDHSDVAKQVRAGIITPLETMHNPKRNRLTQSISSRFQTIKSYLTKTTMVENDTLILSTDGFWGVMEEFNLQVVAKQLYPHEAARKLVELTISNGAPDNVTVVIVEGMVHNPLVLLTMM